MSASASFKPVATTNRRPNNGPQNQISSHLTQTNNNQSQSGSTANHHSQTAGGGIITGNDTDATSPKLQQTQNVVLISTVTQQQQPKNNGTKVSNILVHHQPSFSKEGTNNQVWNNGRRKEATSKSNVRVVTQVSSASQQPLSFSASKATQQTLKTPSVVLPSSVDYYSVQTNSKILNETSTSRNVSSTTASANIVKRNTHTLLQTQQQQSSNNALRHTNTVSTSSRNATGYAAMVNRSSNATTQQQPILSATSTSMKANKNNINPENNSSPTPMSKMNAKQNITIVSGSGLVSEMRTPGGGRLSIEGKKSGYHHQSNERGKQKSAADGPIIGSAAIRSGNITAQRVNQATTKQIQNQNNMPSQGITRRTTTLGTSPMALCSMHSKQALVNGISPIKPALQSQSKTFAYKPTSTPKEDANRLKSIVMFQGSNTEPTTTANNDVSSDQLVLRYSPKQSDAPPFYKSPGPAAVNSRQKQHQYPISQNIVSSYHASSPTNVKQFIQPQSMKGATARLSLGTTSKQLQSDSLRKHQRSSVSNVHQIQRNPQKAALQIDLHKMSQKNLNNISQANATVSNGSNNATFDQLDEQMPFVIYGSSGDLIGQFQIPRNNNTGFIGEGSIERYNRGQAPMVVPPQPMLVQLISQSPQASNSQFFAKSPKTTSKHTHSSNRHSLLKDQQQKQPPPSIPLQQPSLSQQSSTLTQQTKSSIAKASKQLTHIRGPTDGSFGSKSKTQRLQNSGKNNQKVIIPNTNKVTKQSYIDSSLSSKKVESNLANKALQLENSPVIAYEQTNNSEQREKEDEETSIRIEAKVLVVEVNASSFINTPLKSIRLSVNNNTESECHNKVEDIEENKPPYPISKKLFVEKHFELSENIQNELLQDQDDLIYFPGLLLDQPQEPLKRPSTPTADLNDNAKPANQFDDEEGYYKVNMGDHLLYRYEILRVLGKGSFAQVVACKDHKEHDRIVAIKITRNTELDHKFAQGEAKLLQYLMKHDPEDEHNIVRLHDSFVFRDHHCFVFELLQQGDLFEHLKSSGFTGFQLPIIREYAREILKALVFLESHKIIHCDLKPENILLAEQQEGALSVSHKLKLVDFGSGSFRGEQVYTYVQSRFYRAPEVILRLQPIPHAYTEKVDIWSLGCILVELLTGEPLFPGNNEQEQLELIMELIGIPPESFVDRCRKREHYFDVDFSPFLIEDEELGILRIPESRKIETVILQQSDEAIQFTDFIKKCLELDPDTRMSASQAFEHSWIRNNFQTQTADFLGKVQSFTESSIDGRFEALTDLDARQSDNDSELQQQQHQTFAVIRQDLDSRQELSENQGISSSQVAFIAASSSLRRRDEDLESGARGTQYEESPIRDILTEKPKKTLAQHHFSIQAIKAENELQKDLLNDSNELCLKPTRILNNCDDHDESFASAPLDEVPVTVAIDHLNQLSERRKSIIITDNIDQQLPEYTPLDDLKHTLSHQQLLGVTYEDNNTVFNHSKSLNTSQSNEKRRDRSMRKKAAQAANMGIKSPIQSNKGSVIIHQSPIVTMPPKGYNEQLQGNQTIQIIGQFEIFREDEQAEEHKNLLDQAIRESANSLTSGIATEANIPPMHSQHLTHQPHHSTSIKLPHTTTTFKPSPIKRVPTVANVNLSTPKNNNASKPGSTKLYNTGDTVVSNNQQNPPTTENTINKITITFYQKRNQANNAAVKKVVR